MSRGRRRGQSWRDADDLRERCCVAPSPALRDRIQERLRGLRSAPISLGGRIVVEPQKRPGFNDGLILPGSEYPLGTSLRVVRRAAGDRPPLRGLVRVIIVLVDFSDAPMSTAPAHFRDLFFSTGTIPSGSVREYFTEVSHGLLTLTGEVVGPYRLPRTLAAYAGGQSGTDNPEPNARTMARDAAARANADVDFGPYDNDGNGFVDAFIVVHAGPGAEETGSTGDIWSHKWVFSSGPFDADGTKIFGYLTIPENSRIGVCAHELGHLIFGWPDLYDTDGSSEGVGNWCLMGGGSWNGNGDTPAHPSAWCKASQEWVSVVNRTRNGVVTVGDVKNSHRIYRLWKNGAGGKEYFLVEHRKRVMFDRLLPGEGLLVYHVDEAIDGNEDERHPFIKVLEADGRDHLQKALNRGDDGDPYPGSSGNVSLTHTSNPNTKSYGDLDSSVTVTNIARGARGIKARMTVVGPPGPRTTSGASRRSRGSKKSQGSKRKKRVRKASRALKGRSRRR